MKQKPFWITARQLNKLTGWTPEDLRRLRLFNDCKGFFKPSPGGGFLYNASAIPEIVKRKPESV